jgi:hypothetical protein
LRRTPLHEGQWRSVFNRKNQLNNENFCAETQGKGLINESIAFGERGRAPEFRIRRSWHGKRKKGIKNGSRRRGAG